MDVVFLFWLKDREGKERQINDEAEIQGDERKRKQVEMRCVIKEVMKAAHH